MSSAINVRDILLVPLIDVNRLVYAPFDPARDFPIDLPGRPTHRSNHCKPPVRPRATPPIG